MEAARWLASRSRWLASRSECRAAHGLHEARRDEVASYPPSPEEAGERERGPD